MFLEGSELNNLGMWTIRVMHLPKNMLGNKPSGELMLAISRECFRSSRRKMLGAL